MSKDKIKKQARLLVSEMAALSGPVQYQDALELLAKLNGHKNWKTLSALLDSASAQTPQVATPGKEVPVIRTEEGCFQQVEVPGTGFLYRVPVCVETTMSAVVLVRALDREEAVQRARVLVSEGKAPLEVDEGNYRRAVDYYCPDASEDSVFRVSEPKEPAAVATATGCQVGPFLVELTDLGDGEDSLLWADLTVFDPTQEEGEPVSVMSSMSVNSSERERSAFCAEVAGTLAAQVKDVRTADLRALSHAFTLLVQGGLTSDTKQKVACLFEQ